ncbi:protein DpdJ [Variovorax sp. J22R133]|uniref:protein DpdJ n=1 Tax=Variovorax brevis TaxID=3053503 RepID=UPI002577E18C|nr:protein DpdJ [Variovorax sp. J22R133]MDM0115660.1 protein DpdJ [Variovorax sp. J22R133]
MHPLLLKVLDAIESSEIRLLSWGLVDGALSPDELIAQIDPRLDAYLDSGGTAFSSPEQVVRALIDARVIHQTPQGSYRSRLAEGVRLLQRLRQVFPEKGRPGRGDWEGAPTLVADFRIARRPRRYPRRNREVSELTGSAALATGQEAIRNCIEALTDRDGEAIQLAGFQVRATQRILDGLRRADQRATMVCAGTGSGKTIAFYLPVLSFVGSLVAANDGAHWVKTVAIYPRNELLKDQLGEVYAQARRLDAVQRKRSARRLTVGAYFGPAPRDGSREALEQAKWKRSGESYLCDYVRCPKGCDSAMAWTDVDRSAKRERLVCATCNAVVREDEIRLTRRRIEREPPDVLFTTTEMLNRRLSDSRSRHLFGVGVMPGRAPRAVLLDEAHTYSGTHGAQVAYLLRRWHALTGARMTWVGLSATLRDASRFFQELIGLQDHQVAEVSPFEDEYEEEGAEYMIALRGDPASRTSLLSTTIQTAMLLARLQDRRGSACSEGVYASRTFLFTDDIDVTNRLYFDLLDAEGRDSFGNVDTTKTEGGLAVLRNPEPANQRRYDYGQDWQLPHNIGHLLKDRLAVGRTSSQDAGVDRGADVIVATAALEVGFNDPGVGAVLQHKAPRDAAQYLQRKGRAGRLRSTRPWTVVVLSDYGRDRIAYQNYQALFDPQLPARQLPVRNRNVLRMQAVYASIDFLRQRTQTPGSVWTALSGPMTFAPLQKLQSELVEAIGSVLRDPAQTDALEQHIVSTLHVGTDDLQALLWGYPRPLLLAALPTALRRLTSQWAGLRGPQSDYIVRDNPLPDFVPSSLFNELSLPEVTIEAPAQTRNGEPERHPMPMLQAMRQFAPGRVSRRFGTVHRFVAHWIPVPLDVTDETTLDLADIGQFAPLGQFEVQDADGRVTPVPIELPRAFAARQRPVQLSDSSNGDLHWHTQIVPPMTALPLSLPRAGGASALVSSIDAFTHQNLNPLEVRRFALDSVASLQFRDGREPTLRVKFARNGTPTAMGYSLLVDGIRFRIQYPERYLPQDGLPAATSLWRTLRTQRYRSNLATGEALSDVHNSFLRTRLGEVFLTAACAVAKREQFGLREAAGRLVNDGQLGEIRAVLDWTFQDTVPQNGNPSGRQERLRHELLRSMSDLAVRRELERNAQMLWEPIDDAWTPWLRQVYRDTLAAAIARAVVDSCPGVDESQLVMDTDPGPRTPEHGSTPDDEIWISETTVGGAGVVEQFIGRFSADPRRFAALLDRALETSEWEQIDARMRRVSTALANYSEPELADAVSTYRDTYGVEEATTAFARVRHELARHGYGVSHSFVASIANRLLRPGSTPTSDTFVAGAMAAWDRLEESLGIELDLGVVAPMLAESPEVEQILNEMPGDATADPQTWRNSVVSSLLWPRGSSIRSSNLEAWNPFRRPPVLERWLVSSQVSEARHTVSLTHAQWRDDVVQALGKTGQVTAVVPQSERAVLAEFCTFLATRAIESDYLMLYARVRSIRMEADRIEIDAEIAESTL